MKLTSSYFDDDTPIDFESISWISFNRDKGPDKVCFSVKLSQGPRAISNFFKSVAKFQNTRQSKDGVLLENTHFQFVLQSKTIPSFPCKWFLLTNDNGDVLKHDIAFSTTLIEINGLDIPLGRFPLNQNRFYPSFRELKIKKRAYKVIANFILKRK